MKLKDKLAPVLCIGGPLDGEKVTAEQWYARDSSENINYFLYHCTWNKTNPFIYVWREDDEVG